MACFFPAAQLHYRHYKLKTSLSDQKCNNSVAQQSIFGVPKIKAVSMQAIVSMACINLQ